MMTKNDLLTQINGYARKLQNSSFEGDLDKCRVWIDSIVRNLNCFTLKENFEQARKNILQDMFVIDNEIKKVKESRYIFKKLKIKRLSKKRNKLVNQLNDLTEKYKQDLYKESK